jgi:hypothetical protein
MLEFASLVLANVRFFPRAGIDLSQMRDNKLYGIHTRVRFLIDLAIATLLLK